MSETITGDEYASRLRVWCGKDRAYDQLPSKRRDRWILYHAICREIAPDDTLSEPEVNDRLREWLAGLGRPLRRIDIALIRRELIEKGFLQRDPAGKEYRRSNRYEGVFTFAPDAERLDPSAILDPGTGAEEERG